MRRINIIFIKCLCLFLAIPTSAGDLFAKEEPLPFKSMETRSYLSQQMPAAAMGQSSSDPKEEDSEKRSLGLLSDTWDDIRETFQSPGNWELDTLAGVLGGTVLLYSADRKITKWIKSRRSKLTCTISNFAEKFGNPSKVSLALAAIALYSSLSDRQYAKDTSLLLIRSALTTQVYIQGFKIILGRERPTAAIDRKTYKIKCSRTDNPELYGNPRKFHFFQERFLRPEYKHVSMPSGHSAMAFSLATVLSARTEAKEWDYLYYGIAALTALSRVHDEHHWASDVFMGAALGYFISRGVIKRFEDEKKRRLRDTIRNRPQTPAGFFMQPRSIRHSKPVRFHPIANFDSVGMSVSFQF